MLELNKLYLMDCMEGMKEFPDKYFELAIVDPPFGGGSTMHGKVKQGADSEGCLTNIISVTRTGGTWSKKYQTGGIFDNADISHWDVAPPPEYFEELFRVSQNQIIWGGNYFDLPPTRCFLVWRKLTISEKFSMAMCEYAWTSFNDNAKWIEIAPQGTANEKRFHPTQKPVKLYKWLLQNYAKPGDKILDTHVGSASSLIACHDYGFQYIGFEIDKDYYEAAQQRLDDVMAQGRLFI